MSTIAHVCAFKFKIKPSSCNSKVYKIKSVVALTIQYKYETIQTIILELIQDKIDNFSKFNYIKKIYFNMAPRAIPAGSVVGKSFNECTTKSTRPLSKASSSSSVNRDFSPIFGKDLSRILSPLVLIVTAM